MPNTRPEHITTIRLEKDLLDRIEDWRQRQIERPTQSQALRWLIKLGLKIEERK